MLLTGTHSRKVICVYYPFQKSILELCVLFKQHQVSEMAVQDGLGYVEKNNPQQQHILKTLQSIMVFLKVQH